MKSILYVSRSLVPSEIAEEEVNSMVKSARGRNGIMDVSGSLIYTGARFAQFLEGLGSSVE